ncbi:hypothetical protein CVT25_005499 [Psilocybe cyanescens]|uniref:Reverse transcriptase zinc-binding domain-containing protein n=1 Tax=Psilocybe cyanescens TaxID=93625 RepID=A0A409VZW4_PSICY|nr:hypothetical protein CVT25_005499 [Psilocybe cyanescens]
MLDALAGIDRSDYLTVQITSKKLLKTLTQRVSYMEDMGDLDLPLNSTLQRLVIKIRERRGLTYLRRANPAAQGSKHAREAALEAKGRWTAEDIVEVQLAPHIHSQHIQGAKLSQMTQSLLYKGIKRRKTYPALKNQTLANLDMARHAVPYANNTLPDDETLWNGINDKLFPHRIRAYLWKATHNAYKIGRYWEQIPNYEQRGHCHVCATTETMGHILLECEASGQAKAWKTAKELWAVRQLPWTEPSLGMILGANQIEVHTAQGTLLKGASRLLKILVSETAHLIWKTRCQWRITDGADFAKIKAPATIRKTWITAINKRLHYEMLATNRVRYGRKALKKDTVETTWWAVLADRNNLQEDWIRTTGVLVGIG